MNETSIPSDIRESIRQIADDRYQLISQLGQGGMATVYVADDRDLDRRVAIKVLHRHLLGDNEHCTRFRREAQAIAGLDHPGLLEVYELLGQPGSFLAIVMEFVDGPSLDRLLDESPPVAPELAVEVLLPVLRALDHAHDAGIVHRDLKPANILIGHAGRPRLTDFGVAHVADRQTLTDTGAVLGSPAFMSPEGVEDQPIDHRTDLFSVGSLAYQIVTGQPAFSGRAPSTVMRNIARGDRERADYVREDVGRPFADILERLLQYDPDDRPQSAAEAAELFEQFAAERCGADRPSVRAWVDAPEDYPRQLTETIADSLFELAGEAIDDRDRSRALPVVERLMALSPGDDRPEQLLDRLQDDPPETSDGSRTPAVAAVLAAGLIAVVGTGLATTHLVGSDDDSPAPSPSPTEGAYAETDVELATLTDTVETSVARGGARSSARLAADRTIAAATSTGSEFGSEPDPPPEQTPPTDDTRPAPPPPETDEEPPATRTIEFRLVPPSATLTIGDRRYGAMDAATGIELTNGEHTLVAEGPGTETRRQQLEVGPETADDQSIVLDWQDGYIRLDVDRDALVWLDDRSSPREVSAGDPPQLPISFGPADRVDSQREVTLRAAPRDDLEETRERTVRVRPDSVTPVAVNFDEN